VTPYCFLGSCAPFGGFLVNYDVILISQVSFELIMDIFEDGGGFPRCHTPALNFFNTSAFFLEDVVPMTVSPAASANCTANIDTSPVPCVSTTLPGCRDLRPYRALQAVRAA
jgi:hypothetical protein